ncbi:hypothetical protein NHX12_004393 [Muraenolepis orangiensis]|uniref:Uncharacterized protein n=1 Tax=Muraenolepis orangiensis TaxID=630683 RepID=A0A9Q0DVE3_9TELE|nr:hypothetical protein NHX12_004393 [Muraenolepis orangiensis]
MSRPSVRSKETMKGADKAIVAKSSGERQSGSPRCGAAEKPDEPSEESGPRLRIPSDRTWEPTPQPPQGKEPPPQGV